MLTRRSLLLAPLALSAQTPADTVVFSRAYVACPDDQHAQWALEHGRFPHARSSSSPSLWDFFKPSDITITTTYGGNSYKERSVHVPLAITWPGRLASRNAEFLCSHVDVMPTLLGVAGIAIPKEVQGRDLSPLLRGGGGGQAEIPPAVYIEGNLGKRDEWRALIRGYDKIVWNTKNEIIGLYNLANDPDESDELRRDKEHRLTRDSMWALAQDWMARLQDGRDAQGFRTRGR
jgi:hypothetical protein